VSEQHSIGGTRDLTQATHGEAVVRGLGRQGGDAVLRRDQRALDWLAGRTDWLKVRRACLRSRAGLLHGEHHAHPDGGRRSLALTMADSCEQSAAIALDRDRGSRKHGRLPSWMQRIPQAVLALDFLLLGYFFGGITDVNWLQPLSPQLAFAAILAAMTTGVTYGCLAFTGYRLRGVKGHDGHIPFRYLDGLTRVAVVLSGSAIAVLALLMFVRMRQEASYGTSPGGALVVAAALAMVSILANTLVIFVHAVDGSEQTHRLDALGGAVRRPLKRTARMERRASKIDHLISRRARKAERRAARTRSRADRPGVFAEQLIGTARAIHQGTGWRSSDSAPGTAPAMDDRRLRLALVHVDSDLPTELAADSRPGRADPAGLAG
jgi:hypothetical protein